VRTADCYRLSALPDLLALALAAGSSPFWIIAFWLLALETHPALGYAHELPGALVTVEGSARPGLANKQHGHTLIVRAARCAGAGEIVDRRAREWPGALEVVVDSIPANTCEVPGPRVAKPIPASPGLIALVAAGGTSKVPYWLAVEIARLRGSTTDEDVVCRTLEVPLAIKGARTLEVKQCSPVAAEPVCWAVELPGGGIGGIRVGVAGVSTPVDCITSTHEVAACVGTLDQRLRAGLRESGRGGAIPWIRPARSRDELSLSGTQVPPLAVECVWVLASLALEPGLAALAVEGGALAIDDVAQKLEGVALEITGLRAAEGCLCGALKRVSGSLQLNVAAGGQLHPSAANAILPIPAS